MGKPCEYSYIYDCVRVGVGNLFLLFYSLNVFKGKDFSLNPSATAYLTATTKFLIFKVSTTITHRNCGYIYLQYQISQQNYNHDLHETFDFYKLNRPIV